MRYPIFGYRYICFQFGKTARKNILLSAYCPYSNSLIDKCSHWCKLTYTISLFFTGPFTSSANKSSNLNAIPVRILKSIYDIISRCLTYIINTSFTTDVFPDNLKKARMTPIPKEGDKCNLSNYRAISVLPVFSKVVEKVAYTQLYDYLGNNSILDKQQYRFRAKKSTVQAILHYLQYLNKHIDSGNVVFSLFLCFREACIWLC